MIRLMILIMLFPIMGLANNQTLYYEPRLVTLTGIIKILKFPGPPNYTSIKDGDSEETGAYLLLEKPIDVAIDSQIKDSNNQPEKNVVLLQLVVRNNHYWDKIKEGNKVRVTGTLFSTLTAHHHARVLVNLNKISVLSRVLTKSNQLRLTHEDTQFLKFQHLQAN